MCIRDRPRQRDGLGDSGMGRHPHPEDLVRAEPQRVEHVGIDRAQLAPGGDRDHRVIASLKAQRAIRQFGRERRVATGKVLRPKAFREFKVRVRPARHIAEQTVCRQPRRITCACALGRPLR